MHNVIWLSQYFDVYKYFKQLNENPFSSYQWEPLSSYYYMKNNNQIRRKEGTFLIIWRLSKLWHCASKPRKNLIKTTSNLITFSYPKFQFWSPFFQLIALPILWKIPFKGSVIIYVEGGGKKKKGGSRLFQSGKRGGLKLFFIKKFRGGSAVWGG